MSRTAVVTFGQNLILQLNHKPGVLFWTSKLHVDADGHPSCYHPSGSPPGLDYLANAGKPGNWWGLACDSSGRPYLQNEHHEAPGFYVSTTALMDQTPTVHPGDPAKYVHSGKVPFLVLPSKPKFHSKTTLGDLFMVFNSKTGKLSWAIYADIGPASQIGEGSMALCKALGLSDDPKKGGTEDEIIATVYFPGSRVGWPRSHEELAREAYRLFHAWGGYESAKQAMPQINWDSFEPVPPANGLQEDEPFAP